jgi:hypothetical protein
MKVSAAQLQRALDSLPTPRAGGPTYYRVVVHGPLPDLLTPDAERNNVVEMNVLTFVREQQKGGGQKWRLETPLEVTE